LTGLGSSDFLMMKYRKLNFTYDRHIVLEEIFQNEEKFVEIPTTFEATKNRPFDIVSKDLYSKVKYVAQSPDPHRVLPSWKGLSFTHIPGISESLTGKNRLRLTHDDWSWRPDILCPYIKDISKELGYISLQNVRAMILEPPGFGPVHKDVEPHLNYFENHTSITLNLEDGGQPLIALFDGKQNALNDPCFIFQDDCWHGVGVVSSRRTQLRFNGVVDLEVLKKYY